jgi:NAD(P)-dependent dehydrogenase (short-subunit alcohol dehydrogenase family)
MHPSRETRPGAVLVTGGARRVGAITARLLAASGWPVVVHANSNLADAQALAAELTEMHGIPAAAVQADLMDSRATGGLIAGARAAIGLPITGLVNNASTFEADEAADFTDASWDLHVNVNLKAPAILARDLAAQLPEGHTGAVVNIIDMRVFKLMPTFFTYTLSKAGLATATRTLAQALAPRVRVNGVAPGPSLRNVRQAEADFQTQVDATLLGTGSPPEEIAKAVAYLLDARAMTGQILAVDGGQSLLWRTPDVDGIAE